jgi:hypothetical protein
MTRTPPLFPVPSRFQRSLRMPPVPLKQNASLRIGRKVLNQLFPFRIPQQFIRSADEFREFHNSVHRHIVIHWRTFSKDCRKQPVCFQWLCKLDVIASRHILENGLDYDSFERTGSANWNLQTKARVYKGDILTYTTGENIGRTSHYAIDKPDLASNHVNILRIKDERHEYVAFVMNSMTGRLQTDRLSAGSAQAELYPKDIEKYLIPFIAEEKQQKIVSLLEESRVLKEQSKHLLEYAKRAVEIAIEQDEQAAIDWLERETEEKSYGAA